MSSGTEHHTVAIIGAGITGLYAARKLLESGIRDVVILEASNHVSSGN